MDWHSFKYFGAACDFAQTDAQFCGDLTLGDAVDRAFASIPTQKAGLGVRPALGFPQENDCIWSGSSMSQSTEQISFNIQTVL